MKTLSLPHYTTQLESRRSTGAASTWTEGAASEWLSLLAFVLMLGGALLI